ncbi:hypothetical protein ORG27_12240 [Stenotrophomonas lactitubi]|uniref:hypothetical protein n=1 Tax=Stenotrophomonas lactitubi TaxID=2045214 RepID=UPI002248D67C|nr:hypothetical protein [Stenotrophomonas lactitubi]MCX2894346.1 hypothetical protein [Stenotrophomonas lactitubi]
MADKPSGARNFFGRVVDRILPGTNYNRDTGQYSNIGKGIAGALAGLGASAFFGPAAGALVRRGAGYVIDHTGNPVQAPAAVPVAGAPNAITIPSPAQVQNLGFPAQSPGGTWAGFLQGQGSVNNFGNSQFGNGMASIPGSWSPASTWGQGIQEGQGSNLNFGNYSPGATAASGGAGRGGSAGANRAMQVGSFRPSSGMDNGGARGSFLEKINRRGLNIN